MSDLINIQKPAEKEKPQSLQVYLNRPPENDGILFDIVKLFKDMKASFRIYAWLILFCMLVGITIPFVRYQINLQDYSVSTVVMPFAAVGDETRVKSAYVLDKALSGIELSVDVDRVNLYENLIVSKVLSEDSQAKQEIYMKMIAAGSSSAQKAYEQMLESEFAYKDLFIVTLKNSFGGKYLKEDELKLLLERVIYFYNEYLRDTLIVNDVPENPFALINIENLDYLDSLDAMKTGLLGLRAYCKGKLAQGNEDPADEVINNLITGENYRNNKNGLSYTDIVSVIDTFLSEQHTYLYSYVYTNNIVKNKETQLSKLKYSIREQERNLASINENIENTKNLIASYKNDSIKVQSISETEVIYAKVNTDYYNELVKTQLENYRERVATNPVLENLKERIAEINNTKEDDVVKEEIADVYTSCNSIYQMVKDQTDCFFSSDELRYLVRWSTAAGEDTSSPTARLKPAVIYGAAGAFLGIVIWGMRNVLVQFKAEIAGKKKEDKENEEN